jgi:hypothetical protein
MKGCSSLVEGGIGLKGVRGQKRGRDLSGSSGEVECGMKGVGDGNMGRVYSREICMRE